jgi:hypothetical protein
MSRATRFERRAARRKVVLLIESRLGSAGRQMICESGAIDGSGMKCREE